MINPLKGVILIFDFTAESLSTQRAFFIFFAFR